MNETPYELFEEYLQNTLDTEAERAFYEWVNANDENKRLYFEFKLLKDAGTNSKETAIEDSWQRLLVKQKIVPMNNSPKHSFLKYAAAIILIVLSILNYWFFFSGEKDVPSPIYVTGDMTKADQILLPDGTNVTLGPNSTFSLSQDFNKKQRIVYLEGEALFEVSKHSKKAFIVKTALQDIQVLGTKFNVQAYPSDVFSTTTLLEGAISMTRKEHGEKIILKPNEQLIYDRIKNSQTVQLVDSKRYASWVEGYYYFEDRTLTEILGRLAHIYGFSFQIKNRTLRTKRFTGTFKKEQSMNDILDVINISIPIKHTITDNKIMIE